jgi:hypothetical protein
LTAPQKCPGRSHQQSGIHTMAGDIAYNDAKGAVWIVDIPQIIEVISTDFIARDVSSGNIKTPNNRFRLRQKAFLDFGSQRQGFFVFGSICLFRPFLITITSLARLSVAFSQ